MTREDPIIRVRLPDGLRSEIKKAAGLSRRTMNAEIVARLEDSLRVSEPTPKAEDGLTWLQKVRTDQVSRMANDVARIKLTLKKMGVELEVLPQQLLDHDLGD